ncbi:hypothetical protein [Metallibacterium scheffleri]|jgi:hypothetical protein|nr:hypothetical protein [Metallibacterium scheffleri]
MFDLLEAMMTRAHGSEAGSNVPSTLCCPGQVIAAAGLPQK